VKISSLQCLPNPWVVLSVKRFWKTIGTWRFTFVTSTISWNPKNVRTAKKVLLAKLQVTYFTSFIRAPSLTPIRLGYFFNSPDTINNLYFLPKLSLRTYSTNFHPHHWRYLYCYWVQSINFSKQQICLFVCQMKYLLFTFFSDNSHFCSARKKETLSVRCLPEKLWHRIKHAKTQRTGFTFT
jgi:hypothetical protein